MSYHRSGPWLSKQRGIFKQKQKKVMKRLGFLSKKKPQESDDEDHDEAIYKYREGACENCGAMTHTKKFCVERPRKVGVKYRAINFGKNEKMKKTRKGFEAKRDNWEYYDPQNHTELVKEYELEQQIKKDLNLDKGEDEYKLEPDDNTHYLDKDDDTRETNYHSLRQREDVASYLKKKDQDGVFEQRDNKYTGDAIKFLEQEKAVWEQIEVKNQEVLNSVATPTAVELMLRKKQERKQRKEQRRNEELVNRYGEDSTSLGKRSSDKFDRKNVKGKLRAEDKDLIVIKEEDEIKEQMKEETEKLVVRETNRGGHKHVWGSWWNKELGWGYKCCYGTNRYERCLGENARGLAVLREYKKKTTVAAN